LKLVPKGTGRSQSFRRWPSGHCPSSALSPTSFPHGGGHQRERPFLASLSFDLKPLALHLVVRNEEMLDLCHQVRAQIAQSVYRAVRGRIGRHGDESIVALGRSILRLLSLNRANDPRRHEAPGEHRRIHQDEHIERIAVVRTRGRHEPEIKGKHGARR
jgi:hypothetical protein